MQNNNYIIINKIKELEVELENVKGTKCLVYSRIVGFYAPTEQWNRGKYEEWTQRVVYEMEELKNG